MFPYWHRKLVLQWKPRGNQGQHLQLQIQEYKMINTMRVSFLLKMPLDFNFQDVDGLLQWKGSTPQVSDLELRRKMNAAMVVAQNCVICSPHSTANRDSSANLSLI